MKAINLFKNATAILISGSIVVSCTKLDQKVYSVVPGDDFWQTPQQIAAGLAPAYNALTNIPIGDVQDLNEVGGGEVCVPTRGNDWYDNGGWQALWLHTWKPDLGPINGAWSSIFNGIGKANFTLSVVNALANKPDNIDNINAELKVLRAFYYYKAMDMFGSVPIVTDFNTDPGSVTNDQSRSQIFDFLVKEIKDNIDLLPANKDASTYGRMTQWGAHMLLAKLYLNAPVYGAGNHWDDCRAECAAVIGSGKYTLNGNYLDNFAVNNEGSPENIFVVPFDKVNIKGMNWEMRTLHYQSNLTFNLTNGPWNGFCSTADYYDQFDASDKRKNMFLIGQQYGSDGATLKDAQTGLNLIFSKYVNEISNPTDSFRLAGVRCIKYYPEAGTGGDASNDMVIFRLADAYLMRAECDIRSGTNLSEALDDVNKIRTRAGLPDWALSDLTLANFHTERTREMAWEGWSRQDGIRFGTFGNARKPAKGVDPADGHLEIFPIPSPQISSNPNLHQNPGY